MASHDERVKAARDEVLHFLAGEAPESERLRQAIRDLRRDAPEVMARLLEPLGPGPGAGCQAVLDALPRFHLLGPQGEAQMAWVAEHVATCAGCATHLALLRDPAAASLQEEWREMARALRPPPPQPRPAALALLDKGWTWCTRLWQAQAPVLRREISAGVQLGVATLRPAAATAGFQFAHDPRGSEPDALGGDDPIALSLDVPEAGAVLVEIFPSLARTRDPEPWRFRVSRPAGGAGRIHVEIGTTAAPLTPRLGLAPGGAEEYHLDAPQEGPYSLHVTWVRGTDRVRHVLEIPVRDLREGGR